LFQFTQSRPSCQLHRTALLGNFKKRAAVRRVVRRESPAGRPCFRQEGEAHGGTKARSFASQASARRGSPAGLPCFQQEEEAHGEMKTRSFALRASARRVSPCRATLFPAGRGSTRRDEDAEFCLASLCPASKPCRVTLFPAGRGAHGEIKTRSLASRASARRESPLPGDPVSGRRGKHTER